MKGKFLMESEQFSSTLRINSSKLKSMGILFIVKVEIMSLQTCYTLDWLTLIIIQALLLRNFLMMQSSLTSIWLEYGVEDNIKVLNFIKWQADVESWFSRISCLVIVCTHLMQSSSKMWKKKSNSRLEWLEIIQL